MLNESFYPKVSVTINKEIFYVIRLVYGEVMTPIPNHEHGENCYEFHYVESGRGTLIAHGKRQRLEAGDCFVTGPLIPHAQISDPNNPMVEYCLNFTLTTTSPFTKKKKDIIILKRSETLQIKHLLEQIKEVLKVDDEQHQSYFFVLIYQLLMTYNKKVDSYERIPLFSLVDETRHLLFDDEERTLMLDDYFLTHYKTGTLKELADKLHLSTRQTQRIIAKLYHQTFREKMNTARLQQAKLYLTETTLSVSCISDMSGYSSLETFSQLFIKEEGQSPTRYRQVNKT